MLQMNPPQPIVLATIKPLSKKGLIMKDVEDHFTHGSKFGVYILDESGEHLFSEYKLNVPKETTIKMLNVGMVTSKWVGTQNDSSISPGMAVQGLQWIKIHNMTDYLLRLNNNIIIPPGETDRYLGRDHFGVRLGTVFKDQDGVFPDFIFSVPATDIYYGIVSDLKQPLFGEFQATSTFIDDDYEPQFLLENGWMGGPSFPRISYDYIPREGPPVPPLNRWGQVQSAPRQSKCIMPIIEMKS